MALFFGLERLKISVRGGNQPQCTLEKALTSHLLWPCTLHAHLAAVECRVEFLMLAWQLRNDGFFILELFGTLPDLRKRKYQNGSFRYLLCNNILCYIWAGICWSFLHCCLVGDRDVDMCRFYSQILTVFTMRQPCLLVRLVSQVYRICFH